MNSEEADINLDRIAQALEIIAKASQYWMTLNPPKFEFKGDMGPHIVTQCVPQVHLTKCTHTVYSCAVKVEEAPTNEKEQSPLLDKANKEGQAPAPIGDPATSGDS